MTNDNVMNARYDLYKHRSCALRSNANKMRSIKKRSTNKMAFAKPYKRTATWLMDETTWAFWKDAIQSHDDTFLVNEQNKLHSKRWQSICSDYRLSFYVAIISSSAHRSFARSLSMIAENAQHGFSWIGFRFICLNNFRINDTSNERPSA